MIKIKWAFSALEMLTEVHEYISEYSESAADDYIDGIYESVEKLEEHPECCAPCKSRGWREAGYRYCKYRNHLIVYKFEYDTEVNILAIIHVNRSPDNMDKIVLGE